MHSLRPRLLLAVMAVIIVALGIVAFIGTRGMATEFQRFIDHESTKRGRAISELLIYYRQNRNWENVQPLLAQMAQITGDRIILSDSGGNVIADSAGEFDSNPQDQRIERLLTGDITSLDLGRPSVLIDSQDGPVVYVHITSSDAGPTSPAGAFLGAVNRQLIGAIVGAALVGLFLSLSFARRILRPVEALTTAARRMEKGDLNQRVEVHSRDEIGQLAGAFNAMADGLAKQEELRRNMVGDVAHELRTPVSNIRGYLEAIRDGVIEPTPDLVASLHEETMLLSRLLDDLQDLALAEAGAMHIEQSPTMIEDLVRRSAIQIRPAALEKEVTILIALPSGLPLIHVDDKRISQVLRNLLNNALTYTPSGGQIVVRAVENGDMVAVSVEDTGVGIEPEHLPFIFERFYRSDWSRARTTGGAGLGLAIARQWVTAHGGDIWAESRMGQGTTITFTLPISQERLPAEIQPQLQPLKPLGA